MDLFKQCWPGPGAIDSVAQCLKRANCQRDNTKRLPTSSKKAVLLYCSECRGRSVLSIFYEVYPYQKLVKISSLLCPSLRCSLLTRNHDENGHHQGGPAQAGTTGAGQAGLLDPLFFCLLLHSHEDLQILQHAGLRPPPQQGESQIHYKLPQTDMMILNGWCSL